MEPLPGFTALSSKYLSFPLGRADEHPRKLDDAVVFMEILDATQTGPVLKSPTVPTWQRLNNNCCEYLVSGKNCFYNAFGELQEQN